MKKWGEILEGSFSMRFLVGLVFWLGGVLIVFGPVMASQDVWRIEESVFGESKTKTDTGILNEVNILLVNSDATIQNETNAAMSFSYVQNSGSTKSPELYVCLIASNIQISPGANYYKLYSLFVGELDVGERYDGSSYSGVISPVPAAGNYYIYVVVLDADDNFYESDYIGMYTWQGDGGTTDPGTTVDAGGCLISTIQ